MPLGNEDSNGNFQESDDAPLWKFFSPLDENPIIEAPSDSNDLNPGYGGFSTKTEVGCSTKNIK